MLKVYHEKKNEDFTVGVNMPKSDIYRHIWHKNYINFKLNKNGLGQEHVSQNCHSMPISTHSM